jgi:transposase
VVRLHRKGHGVMHIVELTGLSYPAVRRTLDQFEAGGLAAIAPAERGRRSGMGRSLSAEQEAAIRRTICDKRPEQLKMDFALWTRAAVMQLIERQCGITLSVRAVGNYLARWGFTSTHRGRLRFPRWYWLFPRTRMSRSTICSRRRNTGVRMARRSKSADHSGGEAPHWYRCPPLAARRNL